MAHTSFFVEALNRGRIAPCVNARHDFLDGDHRAIAMPGVISSRLLVTIGALPRSLPADGFTSIPTTAEVATITSHHAPAVLAPNSS